MSKAPTRESIFRDAARRMRVDFEEVRNSVPHRGEAGGEGEKIIRDFLDSHLPGRFRTTSGFIIDGKDHVSSHFDIILYDHLNCPVYRTSERGSIIPNDNVASVFEVKFQLTTTLLRSAIKKIHEAKNLAKTPIDPNDHVFGEQVATYGVIFTFESELSYQTVIDLWHAELGEANPLHNSCNLIVMLDRGVFTTCIHVPGYQNGVVNFQGVSEAPVGTEVGLAYLECGERTLDAMLRILLVHLTPFRHRIDHPGFNFAELPPSPSKWFGRYIEPKLIQYQPGES